MTTHLKKLVLGLAMAGICAPAAYAFQFEAGSVRGSLDSTLTAGFGKSVEHNLALFKNLRRLTDMAPVLLGMSRKSILGALTGRGTTDRLLPSVVTALLAVQQGAAMVRVHDVRETVDAIKLWRELGDGR